MKNQGASPPASFASFTRTRSTPRQFLNLTATCVWVCVGGGGGGGGGGVNWDGSLAAPSVIDSMICIMERYLMKKLKMCDMIV